MSSVRFQGSKDLVVGIKYKVFVFQDGVYETSDKTEIAMLMSRHKGELGYVLAKSQPDPPPPADDDKDDEKIPDEKIPDEIACQFEGKSDDELRAELKSLGHGAPHTFRNRDAIIKAILRLRAEKG